MNSGAALSELEMASFRRDGYVVLPGVLDAEQIAQVQHFVMSSLDPIVGPVEYEADVGYPGSPTDRAAQGGNTPRRLLHAYARAQVLRDISLHPQVASVLNALFGEQDGVRSRAMLSQCHHNCVMTKHPGFSSATLWHQDIRYWSFDRPELISAWFALGEERFANGALQVIPGTHQMEFERGRLDAELFLRPEWPENARLIDQACTVDLNAGDILLFHCRLFHAAGRNNTDVVKLSPVFTYHSEDNHPIPGTRSAAYPSIPLPGA